MELYGIIGYPIKHSLSPAMHNAAFKALGIDAKYEKFKVKPDALEDFLLNRKDVKGFNVTVPHKVKAKEILDKQLKVIKSDYASLCGAINTVKREENSFKYANTDVNGFITSLNEDLKFNPKDKNVLLIGCGGAGRAIIVGLSDNVRNIYAYDSNRDAVKSAEKLFPKLKGISSKEMLTAIKDCQLLVNATPIGMKEGDPGVIDKKLLHKGLFVYDVVYNRETELVKDAKSLGLSAVGGRGMLLYQGVAAFEFWTGKKAPVDTMREALNKALKK